MMKREQIQNLLVEELSDLHSAETQLTQALPKLAEAAADEALRAAFETHLEETQEHVERLNTIFEKLGKEPSKVCQAMKGLVQDGAAILKQDDLDAAVRDAALIAGAQRVEQYEIAGYTTACTLAQALRQRDILELLETTLQEEVRTDRKLTGLAMEQVNPSATAA